MHGLLLALALLSGGAVVGFSDVSVSTVAAILLASLVVYGLVSAGVRAVAGPPDDPTPVEDCRRRDEA